MQFRTIKSFEELTNFKEEWENLEVLNSLKSPNLSYRWICLWWKIFGEINDKKTGSSKELSIILGYRNNNLKVIFPLIRVKRKIGPINYTTLELLGQQWSAFYCDILYSENLSNQDLQALMTFINHNVSFDFILLNHLPSTSPLKTVFKTYNYAACPVLKISAFNDIDTYKDSQYSKNLKNNFVKAYSWANKNDQKITLSTKKLDSELFGRIKEIAFTKLEDGKVFKYKDPLKERFRREISDLFNGDADIIMIDSKIVSYRTNVIYRGVKFGLDASYDREYKKKYQLGAFAVERSIQNCFEENLSELDFGPGIDEYKFKFTNNYNIINYGIYRGNRLMSLILFPIIKYLLKKKQKGFLEEMSTILRS